MIFARAIPVKRQGHAASQYACDRSARKRAIPQNFFTNLRGSPALATAKRCPKQRHKPLAIFGGNPRPITRYAEIFTRCHSGSTGSHARRYSVSHEMKSLA